jgi:hypothetical protein
VHILYSAGTRLAYQVNQRFYGELHYVWCAPAPATDFLVGSNPPTSDPWQICSDFSDHVSRGDNHSPLVTSNRAGIIRGAAARHAEGIIDSETKDVIEQIANSADLQLFSPIFMVIPYDQVNELVSPVPIPERANPLSQEFIIPNLPRSRFDVWIWNR